MKKVLKVVGIVILVLLCLVLILTKFLGNRPVAPANYRKTLTTGGEIEAEYMKNGLYTVNGVNPIQGSRLIFLLVAREEAVAFASAKKPLSGKESEIFNMYSEPYRD